MRVAGISSAFAMISVLGFILSAVYIASNTETFGPGAETWGFTFMVIFAIMFIASMISAVKAPVEELDVPAFQLKKKK